MDEAAGEVAGFREEKQGDLLDVGAGGDVDVVVFQVRHEAILLREIMEMTVNFFEIPRVFDGQFTQIDPRAFGDAADVGGDASGDVFVFRRVDEFNPGELQVLLVGEGNGGAPFVPTLLMKAGIQVAADDADEDVFNPCHSEKDIRLACGIQLGIMRYGS